MKVLCPQEKCCLFKWIGEILPFSEEVKQILHINAQNLELMGIIVFGYKACEVNNPGRKNIESFLL